MYISILASKFQTSLFSGIIIKYHCIVTVIKSQHIKYVSNVAVAYRIKTEMGNTLISPTDLNQLTFTLNVELKRRK